MVYRLNHVIQQKVQMRLELGQQSNLNKYIPMTAIFQNNQKYIQLTWLHVIISQSRVFEKTNNQPRPTVQQKRAKSKTKPVIFTTQYKLLGPNINSIIKKHLLIITNNPSLVEMFPKDSMFCAYKRFPNLKNLMVHADPQSIKPLK